MDWATLTEQSDPCFSLREGRPAATALLQRKMAGTPLFTLEPWADPMNPRQEGPLPLARANPPERPLSAVTGPVDATT